MAPRFDFIIRPEDNALVENVKTRASANRQALSDRQQSSRLEQIIHTRSEENETITKKGVLRFPEAPAEEEIAAFRKGGFKVLNLVLGNGPVRDERISNVTEWRATISGTANAEWDSATDVQFITDGTGVPVTTDGLTYSDYTSRMEDLAEYFQRESQIVYGNEVDNVWVQLTGGTQYNASAVREEGELEPGVSDTRVYVFDRDPVTNIDIPAEVADGWTYVEMPVDTLNIISYLNAKGVNLNAYNLIFVELNYRIILPIFDGGPGAGASVSNGTVSITYAPYADQPPIVYLPDSKGYDDGLIINSDFSVDSDSYPIHNLLKQLDATNTTFIDFSSTSLENITSGTSLTSSSTNQTKLQNALNKAYNKRAKIVCRASFGGSQYIQLTEDVFRDNVTPAPGSGSLIARLKLNRKYRDWSLRSTIQSSYASYLTDVYEDDLDLSGLPVGFENASNYDTTYGPYYSSVINRRTI
tara:strand:- start:2522 stop:3934 length:1413 start_codon:yes stop_codon:yes gene_type:complete